MNTKCYKYCAVPMCASTSIKTPEKLFIHVPNDKQLRRKWLALAKRDPKGLSEKSTSYFCEDHFDLPTDMENYVQYTTMGSVSQIRMRSGCLPKKFACQPNRPSSSNVSRPVAAKRRRLDLIEGLDENISSAASQENEDKSSNLPGTSSDLIIQKPLKINKAVQTSHVTIISAKRRSEASQTLTKSCIKQIQTSPLKQPTKSISTSPFKVSELKPHARPLLTHSNVKRFMGNDDRSDSDVSLYSPSVAHSSFSKTSSDSSTIIEHDIKKEKNCELMLKSTLNKIEKKPQFYIGVQKIVIV